jgi:hypothetical protein
LNTAEIFANPLLMENFHTRFERARSFAEARAYRGYDAYDGLASPALRNLPGSLAKRIATQAIKRSPPGCRELFRIHPRAMTKTLALFASADARMGHVDSANRLIDSLLDRQPLGGAWGYEFDVQVRWAFYPVSTTNLAVTTQVIEAFADAGRVDEVSPERILDYLHSEMTFDDSSLKYVPDAQEFVVNVHALGTRMLWRLGAERPWVERCVGRILDAQSPEGGWAYGEKSKTGWIDNFHTVNILDSLNDLTVDFPEIEPVLKKGIHFWLDHFFETDGTPRYYSHKRGPADVHNVATAVSGLARLGVSEPRCREFLTGAAVALMNMQSADDGFRAHRAAVPYMRWNQGHATLALADLLTQREKSASLDDS